MGEFSEGSAGEGGRPETVPCASEPAGEWPRAVARIRARRTQEPDRDGIWPVRHWRGHLSLPVSYWLVGWFAAFCAFLLGSGLAAVGANSRHPLVILSTMVGVWSLILLLTVWHLVGVWRSSSRTGRERGTRFWPRAAKGMVVLGAIANAATLVGTAFPQMADMAVYAAGDPGQGPRGVRILHGGTEIEVIGFFSFGLAEEFRAALDRSPQARVVHLASPGGRLSVGLDIRDEIRRRGLDTFVATGCHSACTVAFLGGRSRSLTAGAKLGFHQAQFAGSALGPFLDPMRRAYEEDGLEDAFIEQAMRSPPTELWYPSEAELLAAHVATSTVPIGRFALSGFGIEPDTERFRSDLRALPGYRELAAADPAGWQAAAAIWTRAIEEGWTAPEAAAGARSQFVRSVRRLAPTASDGAVTALARVRVDEARLLGPKDPETCWALLTGEKPVKVGSYLPPALVDDETSAQVRVLAEAGSSPAAGPRDDPAAAEQLLSLALRRARLDPSMIESALGPAGAHADYCSSIASLYDAALSLPPAQAGGALRFLASRS